MLALDDASTFLLPCSLPVPVNGCCDLRVDLTPAPSVPSAGSRLVNAAQAIRAVFVDDTSVLTHTSPSCVALRAMYIPLPFCSRAP